MAGNGKSRPGRQIKANFPGIFAPVILCIFSSFSFAADDLPEFNDINSLSIRARQVCDDFWQQSSRLRLKFDFCSGLLTDEDKKILSQLALDASESLSGIANKQDDLRIRIERYEGPDWESRYGQTGLWRRLVQDLYQSRLSECEIALFSALTADTQQRQPLLEKILEKVRSQEEVGESARLLFIKAKVLASLCDYDSNYLPLAKKEYEVILQDNNLEEATAFRIELESIKFLGESGQGRLDNLSKKIADSNCSDFELILSLASAQRKSNEQDSFQRTLSKWPQVEGAVGSLLLYELCLYEREGKFDENVLQKAAVFEVSLAAKAAQAEAPEKYQNLFDALIAVDRFRTPLTLYVAAAAFANEKTDKAIDLLISSAKLQKTDPGEDLQANPEEIARQAIALASQKYTQNLIDCNSVLKTYDEYKSIAGDIKDGQLLYHYGSFLEKCGLKEKAEVLLRELAESGKGYWSKRAALDLLEQTVEQNKIKSAALPDELFVKIAEFIEQCKVGGPQFASLESEALKIYCRLLLEKSENSRAQEVINVLTEDRLNNDPNLYLFRAVACRRLGAVGSSAESFLKAFESLGCLIAPESLELLSQVIEQADLLQQKDSEFIAAIHTCRKLSQQCCLCLEGSQKRQAVLILAEISALAADGNSEGLAEAEKLLDDLDEKDESEPNLIRCRARILTGQGRFEQAAELWQRLSLFYRPEYADGAGNSGHWWQAKYYQFFCNWSFSKADRKKVSHSIEVLENTYRKIPDLWAEKLAWLKQKCSG